MMYDDKHWTLDRNAHHILNDCSDYKEVLYLLLKVPLTAAYCSCCYISSFCNTDLGSVSDIVVETVGLWKCTQHQFTILCCFDVHSKLKKKLTVQF